MVMFVTSGSTRHVLWNNINYVYRLFNISLNNHMNYQINNINVILISDDKTLTLFSYIGHLSLSVLVRGKRVTHVWNKLLFINDFNNKELTTNVKKNQYDFKCMDIFLWVHVYGFVMYISRFQMYVHIHYQIYFFFCWIKWT